MGRILKIFSLFLLIIGLILILVSFYITYRLNEKVEISEPVSVKIEKGLSIKEISALLEEKKVISDKKIFFLYSRFKNKPLKSGFYEFKGYYTIPQVWEKLSKGKEALIPFKIIPGENLFDIAKKVKNTFKIPESEFYSFVFNPENVKNMGLEGKSFEGYFPPETYFFRKEESVKSLVKTFISLFKEKYTPLLKSVKDISPYEVMIIASMVEKETSLKDEKPLIAGVIINRLKKNMLLQIDPTVIYALKLAGKWKGKLTKKNIHFDSPFNTYLYRGLPPTPICSFSLDSLKAAINYKKTKYLYYLSKNGKSHIFSRTYREHINALKGYR